MRNNHSDSVYRRRRLLRPRNSSSLLCALVLWIAIINEHSSNVNHIRVRGYVVFDERAARIQKGMHQPNTNEMPKTTETIRILQPEHEKTVEDSIPSQTITQQQQQQINLPPVKYFHNGINGAALFSDASKCPYLNNRVRLPTISPTTNHKSEPKYETKTSLESSICPPLSKFEAWCLSNLDTWYSRSQALKCPFFRRRSGDLLDWVETLVRKMVLRSDRHADIGPPQAFRPVRASSPPKKPGLSAQELAEILLDDWKFAPTRQSNNNETIGNNATTTTNTIVYKSNGNIKKKQNKGYYLTGRLSTAIYRDDCLFLGPDPDLPLRGLRKYMGVASHLFEYKTSTATLLSLDIIDKVEKQQQQQYTNQTATATKALSSVLPSYTNGFAETTTTTTCTKLIAHWQLEAVLRLPWKPRLPKLSGQTIYHVDSDGLIWCHEEDWKDCSTSKAFCATFLPNLAAILWPNDQEQEPEKLEGDAIDR